MSSWCTPSNRPPRKCGCEYHRTPMAFRNTKSIITQIRVNDAAKAEIISRLGLEATHLTSVKMATGPSADVASRLEEVSEQTHALSTNTVDSRLILPGLPPISSTSTRCDPFSHVAPQTCFPAPYPPPPASCLPWNALPTSFISPTRPRVVRSLTRHNPDMSTLTNLFGRMTTTTLETDFRIPRNHGVFCVPDSVGIEPSSPILSPSVAASSAKPQLASVDSVSSPTKPTNAPRRRKIASLPTRRAHCTTPCPTEQVIEETPEYVFASPQKTLLVSSFPSLHSAEAAYVATPEPSITRQRKLHTLHHKTLPQSQVIPQNQASRPLANAEDFSYTVSRSPPLVSDATSYFDSPPTSSDELDTPPSTPPRSHVLLTRTLTEGLAIPSGSDGMVSRKDPLDDAKPPYPRQRYMHLDFTKGVWGRDEQPLTFTFGV
ncbi:hypothetical protein EDB83DRAFT_572861 [Lactarius deliciosus]|nr:hypothetical protein EDB83DRAFT_572861 [Lactarius deliciosus]